MFVTSIRNPLDRYLLLNEGEGGDPAGGSGGGDAVDVDRIKRQGIEEGRRKAVRDVAEELGCTVEEAKAKLADLARAEDARKDALTKAQEEAAAARAEADQARREAAAERLTARIERKLVAAGVDTKALDRATRLVTVDPDADDEALDAEIEALKGDVPGLFTSTDAGAPPAPGVTPARSPRRSGGKTPAELARDRYERTQRPLAPTA